LTSNLPFARWGDVFGDQTIAAAMIAPDVHHADLHTLKGSSYRLRHVTDEALPSVRLASQANSNNQNVAHFSKTRTGPLFSERRHSRAKT
jgi:hypothetical protein